MKGTERSRQINRNLLSWCELALVRKASLMQCHRALCFLSAGKQAAGGCKEDEDKPGKFLQIIMKMQFGLNTTALILFFPFFVFFCFFPTKSLV